MTSGEDFYNKQAKRREEAVKRAGEPLIAWFDSLVAAYFQRRVWGKDGD